MLFAIIDGMPYLVTSQGMAIPVSVSDDSVVIAEDKAFKTDAIGYMSLNELKAKYGNVSSIKEEKKRRKKGADE